MTLVDTIAVSLIGTKELGAIGAMSVIINMMQMSIQTINVINTALVAKELGEKNEDAERQAILKAMSIAV